MEIDIMPSYKPRITVYTDEKTNQKLAYIAKLENRSSSNYTEYLIKQKIAEYEAEHGEIILPPKPTRKEAWEAQKQTLRDSRHKPVMETLKDSWGHGKDYGEADK